MNVHFEEYRKVLLMYLNASKEQRIKIDLHLANKEPIPDDLKQEIRERYKKNEITF